MLKFFKWMIHHPLLQHYFFRPNEKSADKDNYGCSTECPEEKQFRAFFEGIKHIVVNVDDNRGTENAETYHKTLMNRVQVIGRKIKN